MVLSSLVLRQCAWRPVGGVSWDRILLEVGDQLLHFPNLPDLRFDNLIRKLADTRITNVGPSGW
jgi:hypothetical protein